MYGASLGKIASQRSNHVGIQANHGKMGTFERCRMKGLELRKGLKQQMVQDQLCTGTSAPGFALQFIPVSGSALHSVPYFIAGRDQ